MGDGERDPLREELERATSSVAQAIGNEKIAYGVVSLFVIEMIDRGITFEWRKNFRD